MYFPTCMRCRGGVAPRVQKEVEPSNPGTLACALTLQAAPALWCGDALAGARCWEHVFTGVVVFIMLCSPCRLPPITGLITVSTYLSILPANSLGHI